MARRKAKQSAQASLLGTEPKSGACPPVRRCQQTPHVFRFPHLKITRDRFVCNICWAEKVPDPKRPNLLDVDVGAYVRAYGDFIDAHKHEEKQ